MSYSVLIYFFQDTSKLWVFFSQKDSNNSIAWLDVSAKVFVQDEIV